ncbi:MAG: response regulator, partial [Desulfobacterium sp.]
MTMHTGDKIRLLLVDDEEGFRAAIARRLGKRGMVPTQASSGQECLEILETSSMDVVVLDVRMPGMNGIETLKAIKSNHKETQVILLTGNVAVSDGIEGIKSGAFDYLTKPVEIDHLFNKISQAF